ncbi:hypothetical protein ACWF92_14375, partial [Streptomyces massasporeus]
AELGDRRAALSRPFPVAVLHWPQRELAELLSSYPTLSAEYASGPRRPVRFCLQHAENGEISRLYHPNE